jgi:3-oxo-5-alpha-steroid 4-dehydrogenase 1
LTWYTGDPIFDTVMAIALAAPIAAVVTLRFMKTAPYGRFGDGRAWRGVSPRAGWFLMELPAMVCFWFFYLRGPRAGALVPSILAGVWTIHYLNRGFAFPLLMRAPKDASRSFSYFVLLAGMGVVSVHAYLHGSFIGGLGAHLDDAWLADPRLSIGLALWALGFALNVHSDAVLRGLRTPEEVARGEHVYRIPERGGFRLVTNPSYFGELILWLGFALATWSLPGVFILAISAANLVPRAIANDRWYRQRFADYPKDRRVLIPYVF